MHARPWLRRGLLLLALAVPPVASATTLQHLNLKDLVGRADKVFRGKVIAIETTTVRAGAADLPVTVYRLRVEEAFKGEFVTKGDRTYAEVRMVGGKARAAPVNGLSHFSALPETPELLMDREYVLFTTRPSAVGLSVTVGLGQGAFLVDDAGRDEPTANATRNAGLARGAPEVDLPAAGPVSYARLARSIRAVLVTEVQP